MSSPIRVLFTSQLAYRLFDASCPAPFGGAELQMYLLATEMAKDPDYDVHFLTQDFCQPKRQRFGALTVWRYHRPFKGVKLLTVVRRGWSWITTLTTMLRIRPAVGVESPAGFPTAAGAMVAKLTGGKMVYWIASDGDLDGSIVQYAAERALFRWGLRRCDAVVAQNRFQQAELKRRFGKDSVVIPNAFPVPDRAPTTPKESVLWVASSQNLKQPWLFLELARAFPQERFCMIMPPNDVSLFERMSAEAAELPNLEFSSGVPFAQIQTYFDRAKLFVNTSTVEGFPNTFVQAAMGATPVLSLSVNPDDVLTENGFGRCAEGDFERLRADVADLLGDEGLRTSMGHAGFEYSKRTHDIAAVMHTFKSVVRSIAGDR